MNPCKLSYFAEVLETVRKLIKFDAFSAKNMIGNEGVFLKVLHCNVFTAFVEKECFLETGYL